MYLTGRGGRARRREPSEPGASRKTDISQYKTDISQSKTDISQSGTRRAVFTVQLTPCPDVACR